MSCLCSSYSSPDQPMSILAVRRELAFEFREIDIGWSGELYEEHKHDIPVVEIDGKRAFKHRVDPAALKERLR